MAKPGSCLQEQSSVDARRSFLKLASVGTVTGAAAMLVGKSDAQASTLVEQAGGEGYRETAHVKKVYALARF